MAGKRRLSQDQESAIIQAYQGWDPGAGEETVQEIAERLGVTKQTLYAVLARNGIVQKSTKVLEPVGDDGWKTTASALLGMVVETRVKLAQAEALLDEAGIPH